MFKALVFHNVQNRTLRLCLGVLGYLMIERSFKKSEVTFIPSKFIQSLNRKAKTNLIEYLIQNNYISRFQMYEAPKSAMEEIFREINYDNYKKKPHLYLIQSRLRILPVDELMDLSMERAIITNIHHLYQQHFNHWAHNYRRISISVPNNDIWHNIIQTRYHREQLHKHRSESYYIDRLKSQAAQYGKFDYKNYDLWPFGNESRKTGRISNIFTISDPDLRYYSSLENAIEVGIKYSEGVIMADQLLKTIGDNDFSKYFIDKAVAYKEWVEKQKRRGKEVKVKPDLIELFSVPEDELIFFGDPRPITYYELHKEQIILGLFGYQHNDFFSEMFPKAWDKLYQIKGNWVKGEKDQDRHAREYIFNEFVSNIRPKIFLNDWRIQVETKKYRHYDIAEVNRRKQRYYKVVGLVYQLREVQVMRAIWKKLKKKCIPFIPINDTVMVAGNFEDLVKEITIETWREHLNPKIKIFPEVIRRYQ